MPTFAVILPAAGQSSRFRDPHYKKPFAPLGGKPVWLYSAEKFVQRDDVKQVILVVSPEDREEVASRFGANFAILGIQLVSGGSERMDSVKNALVKVREDIDLVAVHDAARPCLATEWIDRVFAAGAKHGAAILGVPVASTLKRVEAGDVIEETVSRERLWEAQTPQVFRRQLLVDAYAHHQGEPTTDESQLVERTGQKVAMVLGSPMNLKITTKEDLRIAERLIDALPKPKTIGPAHPFEDGDRWR